MSENITKLRKWKTDIHTRVCSYHLVYGSLQKSIQNGAHFSHHFVLKFHSPLNSHMYKIKAPLLVKVLIIVSTIYTLHTHNWKKLSKEIYEAESHILMQNLIYENTA